MSGDPQEGKYPSISTYTFVVNSPLVLVDPDGETYRVFYKVKNEESGKVVTTYVDFNGTEAIMENGAKYTMGSNQFVDDVIASYNYIVDNGADTKGALQDLATRKEITNVKYKKGLGVTYYNPDDQTIYFNPLEGLDISNKSNKGIQSPSIGFLHEAAHRFIELTYSKEKKKELKEQSGREATVIEEEFHVIEEFDKPAVEALNKKGKKEAYRVSYGWDSLEVGTKGPTSNEKVKRKERKKLEKDRDVTIEKK